MTDDLLQRLRALSSENGDIHGQCGSALREAADEIERLREWRREVCDRIGMDTGCGKEWTADEFYQHFCWCEQDAERKAITRAESAERERDALKASLRDCGRCGLLVLGDGGK